MNRASRFVLPAVACIAMAAGQTAAPTPKIDPSTEPVESMARALSELHLKQQTTGVRPARLEIKQPGNPIYLVEETEWDGDQWRTYRRPKVDAISKNSDGVAVQG